MKSSQTLSAFAAVISGLALASGHTAAQAQMPMPAQTPPGQPMQMPMQMPAQQPGQPMPMQMPMQMPAQQPGQVMRGQADGEITRIVKETNRITIKHGPVPEMDMQPMTMVYQVKDPGLFDKVKVGDKVRFKMLREGGAMYVESFEPQQGGKLLEAPADPHAAH